MKRISPTEVAEAFAATGLAPVQRDFGDGRRCGCPQLALLVAAGQVFDDNPEATAVAVESWSEAKFGAAYAVAFRDGWDCFLPNVTASERTASLSGVSLLGFVDGWLAAGHILCGHKM